jgi:hypothetical protein
MTAAPLSLGPAILFVPADRPDRFAKAAACADTVILDLEDAVAPADKPTARRAIVEHPLDPARTIVRVDPVGTDDFVADVAAVSSTRYRTVMLAKTETTAQLDELADAIPGVRILALCETAAGVVRAPALAGHPSVVGLMWGSEDLVASLGGTSSRREDGGYRDVVRHARSSVLLAAGARRSRRARGGGCGRGRRRVRRLGLHPPGTGRDDPCRLPSRRQGGGRGPVAPRGSGGGARGVPLRGAHGRRTPPAARSFGPRARRVAGRRTVIRRRPESLRISCHRGVMSSRGRRPSPLAW